MGIDYSDIISGIFEFLLLGLTFTFTMWALALKVENEYLKKRLNIVYKSFNKKQ